MVLATLLLATSFVVGSIAGPLTQSPENQCALTCTENKKFEYEVGKSYIYQYEVTSSTQLISKPSEASSLLIKATAEIQTISKCNLILTLRNVEIRNPKFNDVLNSNNEFKSALEANALPFSFQDGIVEALCPRNNEPIWVLNIKRGILSTFQNSMNSWNNYHNIDEVDITGKCLTNYQVTNGGWLSDTIVSKSKDMLKCTDRADHYSWIRSTPYHPSIVPQSSPLLKSSHECEQTIRHNILQKSDCKENHQFQPFANENSGATTTIQQTMTFQKSVLNSQIKVTPVGERTTLLFDHKSEEISQTEVKESLKALCTSSTADIRPEVPRLFSRFVDDLKKLNYDALRDVYENINNICAGNNNAKQMFMDAIPLTGSEAGVRFMTQKILEENVSDNEINHWLTTLSLLPNPTKEVIKAAMPLLELEGHRSKALLTISALSHTYCKSHNSCENTIEVVDVINKIVKQLPQNCQIKGEASIEGAVTLLKALGNIGYIHQAIPVLKTCYEIPTNPIEVRLAAIDAHRRLPCKDQDEDILKTYLKRDEDSEVRIGAYLIAMTCPSQETLDKIEESLLNEDVNQVGSFVWTHLTSLKNSENPSKTMTKQILSSKKLQKKFSTDVRKFSRYHEGSIYMKSIQTGAHIDSSVIFSPKSYLPRSTHFGLTLDIFGQSVDLFKIGGRMEGFEQLVEAFFGPQGRFPDETIHQILETYRNKNEEDKTKLNQIATIFNTKNAKPEQPRGSFYARLFGNEMKYVKFDGLDDMVSRFMNSVVYMDKLNKAMQGEDIDFTRNAMLLDSSMVIPTSIGLPLILKVNGTASVNLRFGGKLDVSQISTKSMTIKGHIKPSAAVEINGAMMIDGHVARSGIKITTSVHTSTEAEGEFVVKDGQTIKSQIQMAKDKMEIFDFKSSVMIFDGDREREMPKDQQKQMKSCTGDLVSKYLGLELCGEVNYPSTSGATPLLLSGPVSASVQLQKTDKMLTSYDFEYKWMREPMDTTPGQNKFKRIGKLSLDTHKSTVNRELTAEFVYNEADGTVSLRFVSPIKKATFNGNLINNPDHKKLDALVLIDDKECLAFQSELRIETIGSNYRLTPSFAIRLNGQPVANFKGSALTQDKKKYSIDFTMEHLTEQPITMNGLASKTDRNGLPRYDVDFNINSNLLQTYAKWFYQTGPSSMATKGTIDYKWSQYDKQSITFSSKCTASQQNAYSKKTTVEAEFQWTLYPAANWVMTVDMQKNKEQIENIFTLHYGADQHRSVNMLTVQHKYQGHGSWLKHHLATSLRVLFPPANVDTTVDLKSDLTPTQLDASLIIQLTPKNKITLSTGLKRGDDSRKELFYGFTRLTYPNNELEISGSIAQPQLDSLVMTTTGKWAKNANASLIIMVRNHGPKTKSWGKEVTLELRLPDQQPFVLAGDVVINKQEQSAHGEAQINGRTYTTFAEYHRPSLENLRVIAGVKSPLTTYSAASDMQYSDHQKQIVTEVVLGDVRRLKSDIQVKKDGESQTAYANLIMDADNHPNDVYSAQMDLQKIVQGSKGVIKLQIPPEREIGFEWTSKKEGAFGFGPFTLKGQYELWWAPGKKVTADVDVTGALMSASKQVISTLKVNTPWTDEITIFGQLSKDVQRWNSILDIRHEKEPILYFATDGTYVINADLQQITSNVKLDSWKPLVNFKIDHQWNSKVIRTNFILNSGENDEIRFIIRGEDKRTIDRFGISGSVDVVTTSYYTLRKLGLNTNISFDLNNQAVETLFTWNDKAISADYEGNYERRSEDDDYSFDSKLQLITPFEKFNSLNANLKLNTKNRSVSTLDFGWSANQNLIFKVQIDREKTGSVTTSANLISPYPPLQDVQLKANYQVENDLSSKLTFTVQWAPKQTFATNLQWKPKSDNSLQYKFNAESTSDELPFNVGTELNFIYDKNQFKALLTGYLNDQVAQLNIDLSRPDSSIGSLAKWKAQFQLKTPFVELSNFNLLLEHVRRDGILLLETHATVEFNDKMANLSNIINLIERTNYLVINLPLESLKVIKYRTKTEMLKNSRIAGETELSWTPGPIYILKTEWELPISRASRRQYDITLLHTPQGQQQLTLFEMQLTHNSPSTWSQFDADFHMKYKQQNIFEGKTSLALNFIENHGSGHLSFNIPSSPLKSLMITADYDMAQPLKSATTMFAWNDHKPIHVTASGLVNSALAKLDIAASTPFKNYEQNSVRFHIDRKTEVGQVSIAVGHKSVVVTIEAQQKTGTGSYVINLKSSFKGYEHVSLATNFDTSSRNKRLFSTVLDGSLGQLKLNTYYRKSDANSLNVGAIMTSTNKYLDNLSFEYLGGKQEHTVRFVKDADIMVNGSISYDIQKENGFVKMLFNCPWTSATFESKFINSNEEKLINLVYFLNDSKHKTEFKSRLHHLAPTENSQLEVSLILPFETLYSVVFNGQYNLLNNKNMNFKCQFGINDNFKLGLEGQVQLSDDPQVTLTFTSSIPNYETVKAVGKFLNRPNKKQLYCSLTVNNKLLSMAVTLSTDKIQSANFHLETPFDGYKTIDFTANYQRNGNSSVEMDATIIREQNKLSLSGKYQKTSEGVLELIFNIITPFENYQTMMSTLKIDNRTSRKQTLDFALSFQSGLQARKYQLTSELDILHAGYLEYNLKLKSPKEESRFYANYNVQGVHNVTFDVKLIKGKTMMESRGRFYVNYPTRGQGSLAFNTNYKTMITANFNGMFDFKTEKKEVALQSNINGANNELMATFTKSENSVNVDIHGECACPQWQKFALRGWIKGENSNRIVQLTFTRNEDGFSLRGELDRQPVGKDFGKLTLTTPYLKHQSLEISYVKEKDNLVIDVTNNKETFVKATLKKTSENSKIILKFDIESAVSIIESMNTELIYEINYQSANIQYKFNSESIKFDGLFVGTWDKNEGNVRFDVKSNFQIPFIQDNNLKMQLGYNVAKQNIRFNAIASTNTLLLFTVTKQQTDNGPLTCNLYAQPIGNLLLETKYSPGNNFGLNFNRNNDRVLQISLTPTEVNIDIGLWQEPIGMSVRYFFKTIEEQFQHEITNKIPAINVKFYEGQKLIELNGAIDLSNYQIEATFKSPFKDFETMAVKASMELHENIPHKFNVSFQQTSKSLVALNFFLNPNYTSLEANFKSSFQGYEDIGLNIPNLNFKPGNLAGEVRINKGSKAIIFYYRLSERLVIDYKNAFVDTWKQAHLAVGGSLTKSQIIFTLDDNKTVEIFTKSNLEPLKSNWELGYRNDFVQKNSIFNSLKHKGNYEITEDGKYNLMLSVENGDTKLFSADLSYVPGQLQITAKSTIENFKSLMIRASFKLEAEQSNAFVSVKLNDKSWSTIGSVNKMEDGYAIEINNNFPLAGFKNSRVVVKKDLSTPRKILGGELNVNGEKLGEIEGTLEINFPVSIDGSMKLHTPWFKLDDLKIQLKEDPSKSEFMAKLQWSPDQMIVISGHFKRDDIEITMTTPFKTAEKISFSTQQSTLSNNEIFIKSDLKYRDVLLTGLEFNFYKNLSKELKLSLQLTTPVKGYEKLSFIFAYAKPDERHEKNAQMSTNVIAQIKISEYIYGIEGTYSVDEAETTNAQLIIRANLKTIKCVIHTDKMETGERGGSATLFSPWGTHKISGKYALKSDNIGMEIEIDSAALPSKPIMLKAGYKSQFVNVELVTGTTKRYARYTFHNNDAYTGKVVIATEKLTEISGWQCNYDLSKSFFQFTSEMTRLRGQNTESVISVTIQGNEMSPNLEAKVYWWSKPLITASYSMKNKTVIGSIKINSPLTTNPVELSLYAGLEGGVMKIKLNNVDNVMTVSIKNDAINRQYSVRITTSTPTFQIPEIVIDAVSTHRNTEAEATVTLNISGKNYKITGKISRDQMDRLGEITLITPAHKYQVQLSGFYAGVTNFKAALTVIADGETHTSSISVQTDENYRYNGNYVIETPLMDRISLDVQIQLIPNVEGAISLTVGQRMHKAQLKIIRSDEEIDVEVQLSTPAVDIKSVSVRNLKRKEGYSKSIVVTSSAATHSLTMDELHDAKSQSVRLTADTPYLKGGQYSVTGQKSRNAENNEMSLDISTPKNRHLVQINIFKSKSEAKTLRVTISSPTIQDRQIQITTTIDKLERTHVVGSIEVLKGKTQHKMSVDVQYKDRAVHFIFMLKTPLFSIENIESRGQIAVTSENGLTVDGTFKKSDVSYTVKGYFKPTSNGIDGQLKMDTPLMSPIDISVKVTRVKTGGWETMASVQTPTTRHDLQTSVFRENGSFNGVFRLNSPMLPGQSMTLTANIVLQSPTSMQGHLTVENPMNTFKISSQYKAEPENNQVQGYLVVVTPFKVAPYIKLSGQWTKNSDNFEGEFEIYTVDNIKPDLGIYIQLQNKDERLASGYVNIQTSMANFRNFHLKYDSASDNDNTRKSALVLSYNQLAYGYEFGCVRSPGSRKINFSLLWGDRKSVFTTEIARNQQRYQFNAMLDTQISNWPIVNLQYVSGKNVNGRNEMTTALTFNRNSKYLINIDYEYNKMKVNFDGHLKIQSPIEGYEDITMTALNTFIQNNHMIKFQLSKNSELLWDLDLNNNMNATDGNCQIHIKTPFEHLTSEIIYKWKNNSNHQIIAKTNGRSFTVKIEKKSSVSVEYVDLSGPITFKYYCKEDEISPMNGESRAMSSNNYQMILSIPHSKYPLTLSLQKQYNSQKSFNYLAQIGWGDDDNSKVKFIVDFDLQQPNYKIRLGAIHPVRTFDLVMFLSNHENKATGSVNLKWDAARDLSKVVGIEWQRKSMNDERQTEISFKYPGIEMMAIRTRTALNGPLNYQLEIIYGVKPTQKILFEIKRQDRVIDVRVRNPETNYDLQLKYECKCNSEQFGGLISVKYIDQSNRQQKTDLDVAVLRKLNQYNLQVSTMESKMGLNVRINPTEDGYSAIMEGQFDNNKPNIVKLQFRRLTGLKGIQMLVYNDFDKKTNLTLSGGMPDDKTIRVASTRTTNDVNSTDFDFQMNLNQAKELLTRLNWRPESIKEIQSALTQLIHNTCENSKNVFRSTKAMGLEIADGQYKMFAALKNNLNPNFESEWTAIAADLKPLTDTFKLMYENNDYYFKDIYNAVADVTFHQRLMDYTFAVYNRIGQSIDWTAIKSAVTSPLEVIGEVCEYLCNKWAPTVGDQIQKLPLAMLNYLNEINHWGTKFINSIMMESVKFLKYLIVNWIPPISQWKDSAPQWTRHISAKISEQFREYVDEFKNSKYYHQLQQSIHQLRNVLSEIYNSKFLSKAKTYYEYVDTQITNRIEILKSYPWFQNLQTWAENSYEIGKWAYKFFRVDDMAKQLLDTLISRAADIIIYMIEETLFPEYEVPVMTSKFIYIPLEGILEFNQTLPIPWTSFTKLPNVFGSPEYHKLTQFKRDLLQLPKKSATKLYNAFKSEFSWKKMVPLFRATAILGRNQHYVTFDGKSYEFAGACSYLLARDFVDNKFTLSVNYQLQSDNNDDRAIKKSVNLILGNSTIEIKPGHTFTVNNNQMETPIAFDTVKITRMNDVLHITDETRQVFLTYDRRFDVLVFEIGGFYHGKTGGLFGTYDHEPNDDLTDPSQHKMDSIEKFASSWEISSGECTSHQNFAYHSNINSYVIEKTCKDVFNDESLAPCLKTINKEPYMNMCVNDVALGLSPCVSIAIYTAVCKAKGIDVSMPESCLECEIGGSKVHQGEQVQLNGSSIPKSADVVFVLDNTWHCSTTFPNIRQVISNTAKYIEQSLTKNKIPINDNRYALVGFGGPGTSNAPHAITVNHQIFGSFSSIQIALNNTRFTAGHHHHISDVIEYAYDLPFRPGVSKIIVLVPCSESVDNEADYMPLIAKLQSANFIVHLISHHDAVLDDSNKVKASDILGFDDEYAYIMKSTQRANLVGNKKIRNEMKVPEGPMTDMAMETKGSVFFASKLNNIQPTIASLSTEMFSKRVALNANPTNCQNCLCTVGPDGSPKVICSNCN